MASRGLPSLISYGGAFRFEFWNRQGPREVLGVVLQEWRGVCMQPERSAHSESGIAACCDVEIRRSRPCKLRSLFVVSNSSSWFV